MKLNKNADKKTLIQEGIIKNRTTETYSSITPSFIAKFS